MHDLEITWPGGRLRFSPDDSPVLIGRSSSAAVVVPQGTVSRRHLTMNWNGRAWQAEDTSTHGSFDPIGVRLAPSWTLGTDVVVRLGSPRGVELSMRLITRAFEDQAHLDPYADPDSPPTVVDFGPPPPPDPAGGSDGLLQVAAGGDPQWAPEEPAPATAVGPADHDNPPPLQNAFSPASEQLVEMSDLSRFEETGGHFEQEAQPEVAVARPVALDESVDPRYDSNPMDWSNPPNQPLDLSMPAGQGASPRFDPSGEHPIIGDPPPDQSYSPAATFVENDTLRLQIDGEDYVFLPGHEVTIGRDPSCLVTVDERHSLVSRRHLRFVHSEGSWWVEDASSKGTFIHGRRLNRPYRAEGAFIAQLGDPSAGTQLRVVTSGQHRQPTNRAGLAIAAVASAALVIAAIVAWLVLRGDETQAEALATAKQSTVMLLSESGHGSGFFVSRSMIVTNQHVAAMADQLVVAGLARGRRTGRDPLRRQPRPQPSLSRHRRGEDHQRRGHQRGRERHHRGAGRTGRCSAPPTRGLERRHHRRPGVEYWIPRPFLGAELRRVGNPPALAGHVHLGPGRQLHVVAGLFQPQYRELHSR